MFQEKGVVLSKFAPLDSNLFRGSNLWQNLGGEFCIWTKMCLGVYFKTFVHPSVHLHIWLAPPGILDPKICSVLYTFDCKKETFSHIFLLTHVYSNISEWPSSPGLCTENHPGFISWGTGGPHPAKTLSIPPPSTLVPVFGPSLVPPQLRFVPENWKNLNTFLCQIWLLLSSKVP